MSHERLKNETIERLKKAKSRFHSRSYDDVVNKALDVSDGKEVRKLEQIINGLKRDIDNLTEANFQWREDYKKAILEKKPLEDQIQLFNKEMEKKDGELKAKDKEHERELANIKKELQIKGEEVVSLQNDIGNYWKPQVEQLSKDKVLEEKQYLKIQLGEKDKEIEEKNERIVEVEKLIKIASSEKEDIISRVSKLFRDFKQYRPTLLEPYDISIYIKNIQKSIEQFEGYLNTCKNHGS